MSAERFIIFNLIDRFCLIQEINLRLSSEIILKKFKFVISLIILIKTTASHVASSSIKTINVNERTKNKLERDLLSVIIMYK